eukprot:403355058
MIVIVLALTSLPYRNIKCSQFDYSVNDPLPIRLYMGYQNFITCLEYELGPDSQSIFYGGFIVQNNSMVSVPNTSFLIAQNYADTGEIKWNYEISNSDSSKRFKINHCANSVPFLYLLGETVTPTIVIFDKLDQKIKSVYQGDTGQLAGYYFLTINQDQSALTLGFDDNQSHKGVVYIPLDTTTKMPFHNGQQYLISKNTLMTTTNDDEFDDVVIGCDDNNQRFYIAGTVSSQNVYDQNSEFFANQYNFLITGSLSLSGLSIDMQLLSINDKDNQDMYKFQAIDGYVKDNQELFATCSGPNNNQDIIKIMYYQKDGQIATGLRKMNLEFQEKTIKCDNLRVLNYKTFIMMIVKKDLINSNIMSKVLIDSVDGSISYTANQIIPQQIDFYLQTYSLMTLIDRSSGTFVYKVFQNHDFQLILQYQMNSNSRYSDCLEIIEEVTPKQAYWEEFSSVIYAQENTLQWQREYTTLSDITQSFIAPTLIYKNLNNIPFYHLEECDTYRNKSASNTTLAKNYLLTAPYIAEKIYILKMGNTSTVFEVLRFNIDISPNHANLSNFVKNIVFVELFSLSTTLGENLQYIFLERDT